MISQSSQGISFLGAVSLDLQSDISYFKQWLDSNKHADMKFLENYLDLRSDPRNFLILQKQHLSSACLTIW